MAAWFDANNPAGAGESDERGLRFGCSMCGACCSGPPGYVLVSDEEVGALARRFGISTDEFLRTYTHETAAGRSLTEVERGHGLDCVFLDRQTIPGKAICGVYEDRPIQCRTWPFWGENISSRAAWDRAARGCPGMNKGDPVSPQQIRILRDQTPD